MDDRTLLARYAATRDASAFEELVKRYAGLVKAACIRVLGNTHDAEEVSQECFLELARQAEHVHTSVAGWLHRAATSRSLNVLRSRVRRKAREREVGVEPNTAATAGDLTTQELNRIINGALAEMPDDLRQPMMLHYFDGHSQREVATELGVNQSTISRRMRDAIRHLRERLAQAGYVATAPAVMLMIQNRDLIATNESRLSPAGLSGVAEKSVAGGTLITLMKPAAVAMLPIVSFLVFDGWGVFVVAVLVTLCADAVPPKLDSGTLLQLGFAESVQQTNICIDSLELDYATERLADGSVHVCCMVAVLRRTFDRLCHGI